MKTRIDIDRAREARLWIRDVIIPAVVGSAFIIPMVGSIVKEKIKDIEYKKNLKKEYKVN